jgi:putative transposase
MARPAFVPFDTSKAVRVYIRNLPHWRQPGATYFVTFRLADAIPEAVRRELEFKQTLWLVKRGIKAETDLKLAYERLSKEDRFLFRKYLNRIREDVHDLGHGECWLNRENVINECRKQLLRSDESGYHLGDFILMPNHVHILITPAENELEKCMRGIKGASSRFCNLAAKRKGTFWQADSYDHIVRNLEQLAAYREYIRDNPIKARISVSEQAYYRADWIKT